MSEEESEAKPTRRKLVMAAGIGAVVLYAGGPKTNSQFEQLTESKHLEVTDVFLAKVLMADEVGITVRVSDLEGIDALVWIGADGEQVGATEVPYGGGVFEIAKDTDSQQVLGVNRLVAVEGGETDCFGHNCLHSGGNSIESIKFKIQS